MESNSDAGKDGMFTMWTSRCVTAVGKERNVELCDDEEDVDEAMKRLTQYQFRKNKSGDEEPRQP
jgi:hypothetical protein